VVSKVILNKVLEEKKESGLLSELDYIISTKLLLLLEKQ